jgi:hypothetical protein
MTEEATTAEGNVEAVRLSREEAFEAMGPEAG